MTDADRAREMIDAAIAGKGSIRDGAVRAMLAFAAEERQRALEQAAIIAEMHDHQGVIAAAIRSLSQ